jgi:uncharacterized membrane protein YkoI
MKQIITLVAAMMFSITSFAIDVPQAVKDALMKKFPIAGNIKWDKENDHEYEAGFKMDGKNYSANFSDTGEWLETESAIEFNQLPEKAQESYNALHKGLMIKAVAKIETASGATKYEVEYKAGKKTKEVFYNAEGMVVL